MTARSSSQLAPPRPVTPLSIASARLADLVARLDAGKGVDESFSDELRAVHDLVSGLDGYVERCTTPESPALASISGRTRRHPWARHDGPHLLEQEMLSGQVEGQLLRMLVHATRAQQILEIGTFTGYAAVAMAEMLPAGGRLITCELDARVAGMARETFDAAGLGDRVVLREGPALDTLADLVAAGERFGLIFLDADKPGYADYFRTIVTGGLLDAGGLLCVDNTLMQGQPWTSASSANGQAISEFNDLVAADPRVEQVLVPLRDGVTIVRQVRDE